MNRHLSKEDREMHQQHTQRCSASLILREMQVKTTVSYDLTSVRMTLTKKSTNSKCQLGYGEMGIPVPCW